MRMPHSSASKKGGYQKKAVPVPSLRALSGAGARCSKSACKVIHLPNLSQEGPVGLVGLIDNLQFVGLDGWTGRHCGSCWPIWTG